VTSRKRRRAVAGAQRLAGFDVDEPKSISQ